MRKTVFLLLFLLVLIPMYAVDDTSRQVTKTGFDIAAYRVGGDGEGPFFYVIDALDDSLMNQEQVISDFTNSKDITNHIPDYLGLTNGKPNNVLLSFRMEGTTLGTYYVAASVTDFVRYDEDGNVVADSAPVATSYAFDNFDVTFNDTHTTTDGSGAVHLSNYNYDKDTKTEAPVISESFVRLTSANQESSTEIAKGNNYTSAWWTVSSDNEEANPSSSDYWICRGAMKVLIDRDDYTAADNGLYRATVIVEWGTIS